VDEHTERASCHHAIRSPWFFIDFFHHPFIASSMAVDPPHGIVGHFFYLRLLPGQKEKKQ
jgi:hypothetical protein